MDTESKLQLSAKILWLVATGLFLFSARACRVGARLPSEWHKQQGLDLLIAALVVAAVAGALQLIDWVRRNVKAK